MISRIKASTFPFVSAYSLYLSPIRNKNNKLKLNKLHHKTKTNPQKQKITILKLNKLQKRTKINKTSPLEGIGGGMHQRYNAPFLKNKQKVGLKRP